MRNEHRFAPRGAGIAIEARCEDGAQYEEDTSGYYGNRQQPPHAPQLLTPLCFSFGLLTSLVFTTLPLAALVPALLDHLSQKIMAQFQMRNPQPLLAADEPPVDQS